MRLGSRIFVTPWLISLAAAVILSSVTAFAVSPAHEAGKGVYMNARCFACHGELGYGTAGPRFRNDKMLSIDKYVIGQILIGRGIMPAFADKLSNQQIAAVASYVRTSWGNKFGDVSAEQVAKTRKQLATAGKSSPSNSSQ